MDRDAKDWAPDRVSEATPSKKAPTASTGRHGVSTTPRQRKFVPPQPARDDRASSPMDDRDDQGFAVDSGRDDQDYAANPDLDVMRGYAKKGIEERRKEEVELQRQEVERQVVHNTTKVGASVEVSEDERSSFPTPAPRDSSKRAFDQIDYDEAQLRSMSYPQLDKTAFLEDPRHPPSKPAVDEHGAAITLEQKLEKLSQMNLDDQKSFFRSLTDAENEQTGQWFMKSFGDSLKELMQKRLERRKKALEFELEVKKRQKAVDVKAEDIERELTELKRGGGHLLQNRSSPRPRTSGK
jgi:hypothetical protein